MIQEGATFEEFALQTARAFGALVHLRDESKVTIEKILEPPKRCTYHEDALEKSKKELEEFLAMDIAVLQDEWDTEKKQRIESDERGIRKAIELEQKYRAMLAKVRQYVPPTDEHVGHRDFMIDQLESSIDFDCKTDYYERSIEKTKNERFHDWYEAKKESIKRSIDHHTKSIQEDDDRDDSRYEWVCQLAKAVQDVN
jgi:hypothetical protein